ncbi:MAG: DUF3330 domain-containing protein [Pseudomonadota bacterium]
MIDPEDIVEPETVVCDVCLKEIPKSEAKSVEAVEYIVHFCGLECYERWERERSKAEHGRNRPA